MPSSATVMAADIVVDEVLPEDLLIRLSPRVKGPGAHAYEQGFTRPRDSESPLSLLVARWRVASTSGGPIVASNGVTGP